jgi:hypothetical protein
VWYIVPCCTPLLTTEVYVGRSSDCLSMLTLGYKSRAHGFQLIGVQASKR